MRAAIVRWIALAKREMQNYEPLLAHGWELLGVGSRRPDHDLSLIQFPVVQPLSVDYLALKVPGLNSFVKRVARLEIHNLNYMFGLEQHLQGMDIVDVAETYHPFGYQIARAKAKLGYRLVASVQENIPFTHERPDFRRKTKQAIFQAADYFLVLSEMAKQSLVLEGVSADKIAIVPVMGVDTQRFQPGTKDAHWLNEFALSVDDTIILFVGRLTWSKGVFDLLYALKLLTLDRDLRSRCLKLLLVGDGEESQALASLVERLGLREQVRMVTRIPYPEMPKIHNLADIFVLPSISTPKWQEQFGAVLAESMACAKPVVGAGSGAIPEVVGDGGLIAQANDYTSIAARLKELILDESLRKRLGERGRERAVAEYDSQRIGDKIRCIYERLLATKPG